MLPKTRQSRIKKIEVTLRQVRIVAFLFLSVFCLFHCADLVAHAQTDDFGVLEVGETLNVPASADADLRVLIVRILNFALGFLGIIALCVILYAGYLWMTSRGNEETVASAKKMLVNGAIGLTIIMSAFVITTFILRALTGESNGS